LSSSTVECAVSWPRPVSEGAPPVVELPHLSGFLASCSDVAPIGLTRGLRVVWRHRVPKHPGASTSRRPHRSPSRRSKAPGVPLSGLGSPTQFHRLHTARSGSTEMLPSHAPSEVPSPSASCQSRGATYLRRFPTHRLRCALRVSHPLGALLPPRPAGLVSSRFRSWGSPSRLVPT